MSSILGKFLETKRSLNTATSYRNDISQFFEQLPSKASKKTNLGKMVGCGGLKMTYQQFRQIPPSTISDQISAYLNSAQRVDPHRLYILNPRTINRKLSALSSFFRYLVTWYEYPSNPVRFFERLPVHQKSTTETLSDSEITQIIEFMQKQYRKSLTVTAFRDALIIRFLFRYALRRSELVSLRWENFKIESGYFEVIQKGNDPMIKPIMAEDWELLCQLQSLQGYEKHPFVFHAIRSIGKTRGFKPLSVGYVYKMVRRVCKKLFPQKNITPHSFRGTFVGCALNQKIEAGEIANATGHKDVKMVHYYDRRKQITHNAIAKLSLSLTWK